jgi:hypothetical protein
MDRKDQRRITIGRFFQRFSLALMTLAMIAIFAVVNDNFLTLSNPRTSSWSRTPRWPS